MSDKNFKFEKEVEKYKNPSLKKFKTASLLWNSRELGIGYNRAEVDEFLKVISQNPSLSEEITKKKFKSEFHGYIKWDVKFFLEEVAAYRYAENHKEEIRITQEEKLASIDLNNPNFHLSIYGYKKTEVDEFLQLIATLDNKEIFEKNFHSQIGGYSKNDVDWYLDKAINSKSKK